MSARRKRSLAAHAARLLLALAACCAALPASAGALEANIHPSFLPDRLASNTAFTFAFALRSEEARVPPPLSAMVLHLPSGLGVDLGGVATCARSRLRHAGPAGCPPRSLIGRGRATLEVHAGSQSIPEEAKIWALRVPDRGGRPAFAFFGRGDTPLRQETISMASLSPDSPPYGLKLTVSIPPIPTLALEPNASIISFSLTLGVPGRKPRAHAGASLTVPRRCPPGGFPFAAEFTFAEHSRVAAVARAPCPGGG